MRCDFYLSERNIITVIIYSESQCGFIINIRVYYYYYFFLHAASSQSPFNSHFN